MLLPLWGAEKFRRFPFTFSNNSCGQNAEFMELNSDEANICINELKYFWYDPKGDKTF